MYNSQQEVIQNGQNKKIFGIDKEFFLDLFMPKDSNFQNKVMDLTVDQNRFIYYPFNYPDPDKNPFGALSQQCEIPSVFQRDLTQSQQKIIVKNKRKKAKIPDQQSQDKVHSTLEKTVFKSPTLNIKYFTLIFVMDAYHNPEIDENPQ